MTLNDRPRWEPDERQRRIIETKKKVNAELAQIKAEKERAELWAWYQSIDVNESFAALERSKEHQRTQSVRRQMEMESAITDVDQSNESGT